LLFTQCDSLDVSCASITAYSAFIFHTNSSTRSWLALGVKEFESDQM